MAEAGQLPAELVAKINELAAAQFERWKATATAEQKQAGIEKMAKFQSDENFKAQEMEKMSKAWNDADTNGDGKLDLQEYKAWDAALKAHATSAGEWYDEDRTDLHYNEVLNKIGEGEGFTMAEMMMTWGPWMAKFEELKAAGS